jgi:hypothetical protein
VHEFAPVSLERTPPFAISSEGPPAFAPDVAGDLVVWESARTADVAGARDVLATDLKSGAEIPLAVGLGDQRFPRISGRRAVWLDRVAPPAGEVRTCRIDARRGACEAQTLSPGPALRSDPAVSGSRVAWLEDGGIRLCELGGAHALKRALERMPRPCTPERVAPRPVPQLELELSGSRLAWTESVPAFAVWSCLFDARSGACPLQLVNEDLPAHFSPALSGRLFAWEQFGVEVGRGFGSQVQTCRLDSASGACPSLAVGEPSAVEVTPDVAGDVVVWTAAPPGEPGAIYYCEHDPVAQSCPAQRLTGHAAGQQRPAVSGRRVVFEDARDGPLRIYGIELPSLAVRGARRVREGARLRVEVIGREGERAPEPGAAPLALAAELEGGLPVESLGMRFTPRGASRALLDWRPPRGSAGRYAVLLRGTTQGGLVARARLELEVLPAK